MGGMGLGRRGWLCRLLELLFFLEPLRYPVLAVLLGVECNGEGNGMGVLYMVSSLEMHCGLQLFYPLALLFFVLSSCAHVMVMHSAGTLRKKSATPIFP